MWPTIAAVNHEILLLFFSACMQAKLPWRLHGGINAHRMQTGSKDEDPLLV